MDGTRGQRLEHHRGALGWERTSSIVSLSYCRLNFNAVTTDARAISSWIASIRIASASLLKRFNKIRYTLCLIMSICYLLLLLSVSGKSSEDKMLYLIYLCTSHYIVSTPFHETTILIWMKRAKSLRAQKITVTYHKNLLTITCREMKRPSWEI